MSDTQIPQSETALILFSGGRDSLAAATYYLTRHFRVDLYTFDNGAERHLDLSQQTGLALTRLFPEQCTWQSAPSIDLFHEMVIETLEKDIRQFGSLICAGCKLAMLTLAIAYCKEHQIGIIADGFRVGQEYYPEQTPEFIEVTKAFAAEYGIRYEHPIYDLDEHAIDQLLQTNGITIEPLQAACLFGLNRMHNPNIRPYLETKLPLARAYLTR